jgi:Uma2 family endonuclease
MRFTINTQTLGEFLDEQLYEFFISNKGLKIERNSEGQIIIMPPTRINTSFNNSNLLIRVGLWNQQYKLGKVSDSSGAYTLPSEAIYAPNVA